MRRRYCERIINQNPYKIRIICEKDPKSNIRNNDKTRYLIFYNFNLNQFILIKRIRIGINREEPFFLLANGKHSISGETLLSDIYERYKDPQDGFLYKTYTSELTWK